MRLVALGASNLTRGLQSVVAAARESWGRETEILAALGHGRSYGAPSQFLCRSLPGILQCGLWQALEARRVEPRPTLAVVTDVGNDILYGYPPALILDWVSAAVERLQCAGAEVRIAGLPLEGIGGLSTARFIFFRSLFVPSCRLPLAEVVSRAAKVQEGLGALARARSLCFVPLHPEWYGLDPIHIRPSWWAAAWRELLGLPGVAAPAAGSTATWAFESARLYAARPERMRLLGIEHRRPQPAYQLGIRLSLY